MLAWLLAAALTLQAFFGVGLVTTDNPWWHRVYDGVTFVTKRFSGIVGDAAHALGGGYHIGRILQPAWNYSVTFAFDREGDPLMSAGFDLGLGPLEMIVASERMKLAMTTGNPQAASVREFNGTTNGVTTFNCDATLGGRQNYVPDGTHIWHGHFGGKRNVWTTSAGTAAAAQLIAVLNGAPLVPQTSNPTRVIATEEITVHKTINYSQTAQAREQFPLAETDEYLRLMAVDKPVVVAIRPDTAGARIVPAAEVIGGWEHIIVNPGRALAVKIDPAKLRGISVDLRTDGAGQQRDRWPNNHGTIGVRIGPR